MTHVSSSPPSRELNKEHFMKSLLRRRFTTGIMLLAAISGGVGVVAAAPARQAPVGLGRCPAATPLRLPADGLARAIDAALAQAPRVFEHTDITGIRAVSATIAGHDPGPRAREVRRACGRKVAKRTVIVSLELPALRPSASLSEGIVAVSRFSGGYEVWSRLH
jgi:hypothetical protein